MTARRSRFAITALGLTAFSLAGAAQAQTADTHVGSTIITGAQAYPTKPVVENTLRPGDISLNFPGVEVHELAKTILGDMLKLNYAIEPSVNGSVTLVTAQPIARADMLAAFEDALHAANLALLRRGGAFVIAPIGEARIQASALSAGEPGFGSETIQLQFIGAAELKKLLDPVIPDTISIADPTRNIITVTGTAGQRRSVRDLVAQFDADWLRGMSFALYIPKNTDARLIEPEIEKLLNGDGAPSAGLVRLITMERINGILAIAAQPQYLEDVKRWIEVLDREGQSNEPRLFVYRVENGRSSDLAKVLTTAFGAGGANGVGGNGSGGGPPTPAGGFDYDAPTSPLTNPPAAQNGGNRLAGAQGGANETARQANGLGGATITSDETNNAVLIYATPREYAIIEEALRQLDIAPVQVLIEAAVTEVTLNHDLQYGVQWNFAKGYSSTSLIQNTGTVTSPSTTVSSASSPSTIGSVLSGIGQTMPGFNYLFSNGNSITATLNALSGLTTVNVLSAPKMLVLNNHTASLEVGDQVPVVTASAVSNVSAAAPTVNSVDYRDTGVILKVTPRVNSGGLVLLDIAQEVSDVTNTSTSSINSPTIEQRKFSTSIAIQDGQTIALGGLIKDTRTKGRSGLPFLSSIPILGALAGNQTDSDVRTELLILLTPRVIRSSVDAQAVTDELRKKIEAIAPLPPVKSIRP